MFLFSCFSRIFSFCSKLTNFLTPFTLNNLVKQISHSLFGCVPFLVCPFSVVCPFLGRFLLERVLCQLVSPIRSGSVLYGGSPLSVSHQLNKFTHEQYLCGSSQCSAAGRKLSTHPTWNTRLRLRTVWRLPPLCQSPAV